VDVGFGDDEAGLIGPRKYYPSLMLGSCHNVIHEIIFLAASFNFPVILKIIMPTMK
jgi:hypothetical protein